MKGRHASSPTSQPGCPPVSIPPPVCALVPSTAHRSLLLLLLCYLDCRCHALLEPACPRDDAALSLCSVAVYINTALRTCPTDSQASRSVASRCGSPSSWNTSCCVSTRCPGPHPAGQRSRPERSVGAALSGTMSERPSTSTLRSSLRSWVMEGVRAAASRQCQASQAHASHPASAFAPAHAQPLQPGCKAQAAGSRAARLWLLRNMPQSLACWCMRRRKAREPIQPTCICFRPGREAVRAAVPLAAQWPDMHHVLVSGTAQA